MFILVSSVKKASNVWVPALGLMYIYAAVGLYSFSGICVAIQIWSTASAETLPTRN